jgi:hypothetical protein
LGLSLKESSIEETKQVLRRIFGSKRGDIAGRKELHREEIRSFQFSLCIIREA